MRMVDILVAGLIGIILGAGGMGIYEYKKPPKIIEKNSWTHVNTEQIVSQKQEQNQDLATYIVMGYNTNVLAKYHFYKTNSAYTTNASKFKTNLIVSSNNTVIK